MNGAKAVRKQGVEKVTQVPADEARRVLGDLLNRAGYGGERIEITRFGRVIAVLVSPETLNGAAA